MIVIPCITKRMPGLVKEGMALHVVLMIMIVLGVLFPIFLQERPELTGGLPGRKLGVDLIDPNDAPRRALE